MLGKALACVLCNTTRVVLALSNREKGWMRMRPRPACTRQLRYPAPDAIGARSTKQGLGACSRHYNPLTHVYEGNITEILSNTAVGEEILRLKINGTEI